MLCFLCKRKFNGIKSLFIHFKRSHDLRSDDIYRCCELECNQIFKSLGSFKKHINRKHINSADTLEIVASGRNFNNFENQIDFYSSTDQRQEITGIENNTENVQNQRTSLHTAQPISPNNKKPNCDTTSKDNCYHVTNTDFQKKIHDFIIKFVLTLHNTNNFSRKDVFEIQICAKKFLIDPLLDTLIGFAKCNFHENSALYNKFYGLITSFINPFDLFNTDHLLFKTLQKKGYIDEVKQFIVNNEVRVIHRQGRLVADEKQITGILMPLKFQFKHFFEKEGLLENTLNHMKHLQTGTKLTNFVQGELWKKKC